MSIFKGAAVAMITPMPFELLSQLLDIKADNTVVDIHIGTVVKNIQAAMHIQFQCRRDPLRDVYKRQAHSGTAPAEWEDRHSAIS